MLQQSFDSPRTRIDGSVLQRRLLERRYLSKDADGRVVETPAEMIGRVADAVASAEAYCGSGYRLLRVAAGSFRRLMQSGRFLPNSPTLMNAGRPEGLLSACFVLPVDDDLDAIFRAVWQAAQIQKKGGGTGFAFDGLRPTGDLVASSGGTTSGPVSFMKVFSEATGAIQQGAFRRGANMGMMAIDHPDILRFITAKDEPGAFPNFNLSVKVSDAFMKRLAAEAGSPHVVINPRTGRRYAIPRSADAARCTLSDLVPADRAEGSCYTVADVWDLIVRGAHATGEPGIAFIDRINADNPTPHLDRIEATNPCGEQPLLPYEACNLGSIDLSKFVERDRGDVDWKELARTIDTAVRFLDDVIDVNHYPIPEIREITSGNRKIGLGIMGFADALLLLGVRYDSDEALALAGKVSRFLTERAHEASCELAEIRGSFPNWEGSIWDTDRHRPMRNAACTTIAPTGGISILAGCSSGIEPVFAFARRRRALDDEEFIEMHPLLEDLGRHEGWLDEYVRDALLDGVPPLQIERIPGKVAEVLVTAHEVAPEWHVRIQAAFQQHIDNAVSKTVNLPAHATVADVDRVFRQAFELGCKGVTVYRDGSREGQTLSVIKAAAPAEMGRPRPRTHVTTGQTFKFRMGCGTLFVTVNRDEEGICEVFANLGKAGGCPSQSEATCRSISAGLRSGVDPSVFIEQLKGIRCLSTCVARKGNKDVAVLSCPDAMARAIEEAMGDTGGIKGEPAGHACPDCGAPLRKEAGCLVCDCGFSKCG